MRSIQFKQVLRDVSRSLGINPDEGSYTEEFAQELAEAISARVAYIWTKEWWPFAMKAEQRQYRATYDGSTTYAEGTEVFYDDGTNERYYRSMQNGNVGHVPSTDDGTYWMDVEEITADDVADYEWDPYVAWEQTGETLIPEDGFEADEFFFFADPSVNEWARPLRQVREDTDGVHVVSGGYPVRPWIKFRPDAPRFTAELHDLTVTYLKNACVYDATTGECYVSLQDSNVNHAVTDTAWWVKQEFPRVFFEAVRMYARAERFQLEERFEAALAYESRADKLVDKLADDFFSLGGRQRKALVR